MMFFPSPDDKNQYSECKTFCLWFFAFYADQKSM